MDLNNRFKGLDLVDRVPVELSMEDHNVVQEFVTKSIPKKKKCKKINWLAEKDLQIAEKRRFSSRDRRTSFVLACIFKQVRVGRLK